jgi:hypothetical protein
MPEFTEDMSSVGQRAINVAGKVRRQKHLNLYTRSFGIPVSPELAARPKTTFSAGDQPATNASPGLTYY